MVRLNIWLNANQVNNGEGLNTNCVDLQSCQGLPTASTLCTAAFVLPYIKLFKSEMNIHSAVVVMVKVPLVRFMSD